MNAPADPPPDTPMADAPPAGNPPRRSPAARLLGDRATLGYLLVALSTVCFAANNNLAKESYQHGASVDTVLVGRSWFLALLLALWFAALRSRPSFPRGMGRWVLFAVMLFSLNGWALMSAFDRMSVSLSILIFYLFPFIVGLLAAALRIERLRPAMLVGLAVAFFGLFLALDTEGELDLLGVALAALSALAISGNILVSGKLFRRGMSPVSLALWVMIGASVVFAITLASSGGFRWPDSGTGWWAYWGSVVFVGIAFIMFYAALDLLRESRTALVMNLEPIATIVMAVALFGEAFGATQWAGAVLVVLAIIGVTLAGRKA
ncbi:MAG: DMT family transporter [Rhodospirillaceae bacterium]|nr:DMT family transporter [Rhodospirillaceae bacterium]MYB12740.1 DMT family transporter [Rhodospirillaceae bacterium]MYI49479.1 DMT family transporter [Rhodospirillaceae bacterium]